ncbi:MAG: hypothetical protein Q9222_002976 [Ikaeria aurantiellina]
MNTDKERMQKKLNDYHEEVVTKGQKAQKRLEDLRDQILSAAAQQKVDSIITKAKANSQLHTDDWSSNFNKTELDTIIARTESPNVFNQHYDPKMREIMDDWSFPPLGLVPPEELSGATRLALKMLFKLHYVFLVVNEVRWPVSEKEDAKEVEKNKRAKLLVNYMRAMTNTDSEHLVLPF